MNLLSVIVPSIRTERLPAWYESFAKSYSGPCEVIVVSPLEFPMGMAANVRWRQDWGSAVRCQQIGLMMARGAYVHRGVDDSLYLPGMMDAAVKKLTGDQRTIVAPKYTETNASVDRSHKDFQDMSDPKFYTIGYHNQAGTEYVPAHYKLLNFGIVARELMVEVGGWDCQFESVAIAELDVAVRLQHAGARILLSDDITLECDWMPGAEGDHGPMHDAFAPDMEKYRAIYSLPSSLARTTVPLDNWRDAPAKWERRFGK